MPSPLVPFVGRAAEVAAITAAIDAAADGAANVVAVAGEPGVGKSALVEEADGLARARGFLTLRAGASPLHADLPYGIFVEALRPIMRTVEAGARTRLVEGLPDIGRLFDGLGLPAAAPLGDSGMERTRLFEAVCKLFDRLTGQQPVLLIVDDLHWADSTSLALVDYVVRGLADRRFLLMVTYRIGESGPDLEVLRRSGAFRALAVEPLGAADIGALARGLLADDPPETLTSLLIERAGGLPLFVRSLVTMLIDSGRLFRSGGRWVLGPEPVDDLPPELIGLLRSRLDALRADDRRVFDTLAVAGGSTGHELLAALHPDEGELLGSVQRLRGTGLLTEELGEAGVSYRVTHPLLAEVAYNELTAVRRRRAHAAIVSALAGADRADIGRLAHHVRGAGDEISPGTALEILVTATEAALDDKAGAEAAAHAAAAIVLAGRANREDLLPRLRDQRAEALEVAGRTDAAIEAWHAAVRSDGSPEDRARRLRRLAIAEWDAGRLAHSQVHIDQAMAVLADTAPGPVHLAVAETRGRMLSRRGLLTELRAAVSEFERLATATGSPRVRTFAQWAKVDLLLHAGDHRGASDAVAAMMRLARNENSILLLEEAHRPAVCNALAWGDHRAARRLAENAQRLARESGGPALEIPTSAFLAFVDFVSGRWDEACAGADRILADSHRAGMRRGAAAALCIRALVHTRRGQYDDAATCLREAAAVYREGIAADRHLQGVGVVCQAMILLGRGDGRSALEVARTVQPSGVAVPAFCLGVVGEAQVATGDSAGAMETAALLARHGPGAPYPAAVSDRIRGLAARAEGKTAAAAEEFARAVDGFTTLDMEFEAAITRLDWTETDGADRISDDLDLYDRLGARPAADRARRVLRGLGVRPAAARTSHQGELTAREAEIAGLVADGLTNNEIAERLFISQRTVTTHLQRIYQRLSVGSRTGLTRYVLEHPRNT